MSTPPPTALARRLRDEMRANHLSQAAVAQRVGVSQQTVSKWLTGETQPRPKLFQALADVLGIDARDLTATLVAPADRPLTLDEAIEQRLAVLDRRIRDLTPEQLHRLEAYVRGLRDGAA